MPPNGRITMTAMPSSSASGSRRCSASRSPRLSGSCTVSNRPLRSARSSSPNAAGLQCVTPMRSMRPGFALRLEPREVLLPRDEVVHLLDLDAAEEAALRLVLRRDPPRRSASRSSSRPSCPRACRRAPARAPPRRRRTSARSRTTSCRPRARRRPPPAPARRRRRRWRTCRARRPGRGGGSPRMPR